jgi:hypothetical protein
MSLEDLKSFFSISFEKGDKLPRYFNNFSSSRRTKKKVKSKTKNCKNNVGKFKINFEKEFIIEFVNPVTKECRVNPISLENCSD